MSGSSMAAPQVSPEFGSFGHVSYANFARSCFQVAGVVALVLSARRKALNGFQMKALLSTTSELIPSANNKLALECEHHDDLLVFKRASP